MQENNNNQYTAILATGSRKSRYENKQVDAEKQHDSHTSSILPCSARQPLNAVYSESRDGFKFLHVLAMICLYRETGKRVCTVTYTVKVVRSWWHLSLGMQAVKRCKI